MTFTTESACIPDGIYRMEFIAGEPRDNSNSNLHAQVIDGPEAGKFCGEIVQRSKSSISNSIDASAIEAKTKAYLSALGIEWDEWDDNDLSHEVFLFHPFVADVREGRIAAISIGVAEIEVFPMAGLSERPRWDADEGAFVWSTTKRYNKAA